MHGPNHGAANDPAAPRARAHVRARGLALAALGAGLLHGLLYLGAERTWRAAHAAVQPPAAMWIQAAEAAAPPAVLPTAAAVADAAPAPGPALLEPLRAEPTRAAPKPKAGAKQGAELAAPQPVPAVSASAMHEAAHDEPVALTPLAPPKSAPTPLAPANAAPTLPAPPNAAPPAATVELAAGGDAPKLPAPSSASLFAEITPAVARGDTPRSAPDTPTHTTLFTEPVPVYATDIAPATTLRFRMRRNLLHGNAELAWRPEGGRYEARFEARVSGVTLLTQVSQGGFDSAGLAPQRYTDKRPRRSATAANFQRDAGPAGAKVTFSGSASEIPLYAGAQDRLSWMVQLSAIAGGEPQRLAAKGRISMHVIGARADAAVWQFVSFGEELLPANPVPLRVFRLQRLPQSVYDTRVDIWLDAKPPHWLVRAHLSNGPSDAGLELWRIDSEPR